MSADYHLIRFDGELDISRYPDFRMVFERIPPDVPVLVDLTGAESVDSTFLTELLVVRRRHTSPFSVLLPPSGNVAKIFAIAGLGTRLHIFHDLSAAVESLGVTSEDPLNAE